MSRDEPDRPHERTDDEQERLSRQISERFNEIRAAMPGVQVLFGFLLTVVVTVTALATPYLTLSFRFPLVRRVQK
jgi:hypothetical protein